MAASKHDSPRNVVDVLWCSNQRRGRSNGWSFPPAVERHLRALTAGQRVCHLFGGRARWGVRIDIDPIVTPHVRADAYMPPFVKDAFDVVILDPYFTRGPAMKYNRWIAGQTGLPYGQPLSPAASDPHADDPGTPGTRV